MEDATAAMSPTTNPDPPAGPTSTFTLFPTLPLELRLQIYTQTLPPPQTIPIRFWSSSSSASSIPPSPPHYQTTIRPHALLHISRETRTHYLTTHTNLILNPSYPSTIYLNLLTDTIFFDSLDCSPGGDLAFDLMSSPCRDAIKRVAFEVGVWEVLRVFRWEGLSECAVLGGLEEVKLVLDRSDSGEVYLGGDAHERPQQPNTQGTVQSEIAMSNAFVDGLRGEIAAGNVLKWEERGVRPAVRLCVW